MSNTTPDFAAVQYTNGYEFTQGTGYNLPEYPFVKPPELVQKKALRHAVVIVGGLITSTLLGLGVTPTVFYTFGRKAAQQAIENEAPASH